jgi:two-component system chemotaxis response regulator CheB
VLPAILERSGSLPARHARASETLHDARILVAPPDHHLVVDDGRAVLSRGPKENGHRPAIDVLFRSAARSHGAGVIGVVLSGVLDDGTAGLGAIASRGGVTIAQDPEDALYPNMPTHAIEHVHIDSVLAAKEIGPELARLVNEDLGELELPVPPLMDIETNLALMSGKAMNESDRPGRPSGFSCPDCNGVLYEIRDGDLVRYRCRVGHAWSSQSLLGEQAQQLDSALWMALRGLEEKAALARTMGERAEARNSPLTSRRFAEQAEEATRAANLIRTMLESHDNTVQDEADAGS